LNRAQFNGATPQADAALRDWNLLPNFTIGKSFSSESLDEVLRFSFWFHSMTL
jgi:hypothetical protein